MRSDRCVGRSRELGLLRDRLVDVHARRAHVVVLAGEAGIGKTTIAAEIADEAASSGFHVAWARCDIDGSAPPYWLWHQVLRHAASALPRASENQDRYDFFDEVTRRILDMGEVAEAGAVVVLDDAQWADEPSRVLLRHLVSALRNSRLLIVMTHRTGDDALITELLRDPLVERVDVGGLSAEETAACIEVFSGTTAGPAEASSVFQVTRGNPFFVREVTRAGLLSSRGVPDSVLDVVRERVRGLGAPTQLLLRTAAVAGDEFSLAVVATVLGEPASTCFGPLEEARRAAIIEDGTSAGSFRFSHALVRMALEQAIPADARLTLHRQVAHAIEQVHAGHLEPHLAELATHWSEIAAGGGHGPAVEWCRRAADEALRVVAFEEAVRLYRLALHAGGSSLGGEERCALLRNIGIAEWRALNLDAARAACAEAFEIGRRLGRADWMADAALVIEAVGDRISDRALREWCEEVLTLLPDDATALHARVSARLTEALIYEDELRAVMKTSARALTLADASDDATAVVAALRARQLACAGPEHVEEREVLAARMLQAGVLLRRPLDEMFGWLWTIDTHFERGRLSNVPGDLARLRVSCQRVGGPVASWHVQIVTAALAQATARFDDAFAASTAAFAILSAKRHPAAFGAYMANVGAIRHHVGFDGISLPFDTTRPPLDMAPMGEARSSIFSALGPAVELAEAGRLDEARDVLGGAGPMRKWSPPPYFRLAVFTLGARVAGLLGELADLRYAIEQLSPWRGSHVVTGAGTGSYLGPVELWLGRAARELGDPEAALPDLRAAEATCRANGARGFAVEAACEIAAALADLGESASARTAASAAGADATRLGMVPWVAHAQRTIATTVPSTTVLSARETEVASLVAEGRTNREIAAVLYLSERTAQNHVQHILLKLGFTNRSQIAAWVAAGGMSTG